MTAPNEPTPPRFDLAAAFRARQQQLESDLGFGRPSSSTPAHSGTRPSSTGAECWAISCRSAMA